MLRLDVGVGAEDGDQLAHERASAPTSSATGAASMRDVVDPQQDHRHVVVLRRVADERRDLAQHALAQLIRRQVGVLLDELRRGAPRRSSRRRRSSPR